MLIMLNINKRLISIVSMLIVSTMVFGLFTGCSGKAPSDGNSTNDTSSDSGEKVKISFTWWGDTARNAIYNKICDLFETANPNIKVDRPFGSWAQYWDKLATQIASGSAPDIIGMHQDYVSEYSSRKALLDLKPYVDSGILKTSDIPESAYKGGFISGKLYMIPQGIVTSGYLYNTATFDKLGIEYPKMDWTWEEFAQKAIEIKKVADSKNIKMWGSSDDSGLLMPTFNYWVRTNGQVLFTDEGKIGFTQDVAENWFIFWKNLRDKNAIPDASTNTEYANLPIEQNLFSTGKVGIASLPANQLWLYQNLAKSGNINIVRIPHLAGKANGEYVEGSFLSITAASKHPKEAAKFINFFINNTDAQRTFKLEQGVPATTTAVQAVTPDMTPVQLRTIKFVNDTLKIAGNAPYAPAGVAEIRTDFTNVASEVAFNKITPREGAIKFIKQCNDVLSRK
ncbi:MAG TPA: sugar-binding protein [Clostridiaceae bacterium]|mgnify:CR=1 FL=1|nr:sugar-binding protein [Clostridiaceae bacterium]